MVKIVKQGKVVILLTGRHAGHKAIVVRNFDDGTGERPYGHAVVAGIERYPLKITNAMKHKTIVKRARVKPFIKVVNYNHFMPTRYGLDIDLKNTFKNLEQFKDPARRIQLRREIRNKFEARFRTGKNKWFFQKLRF